jgi:hypothetical protein
VKSVIGFVVDQSEVSDRLCGGSERDVNQWLIVNKREFVNYPIIWKMYQQYLRGSYYFSVAMHTGTE